MKLNPPASSSDLDVARAVARRLHERALHGERSEAPAAEGATPPPVARPSEPAGSVRPAPEPEPSGSEPDQLGGPGTATPPSPPLGAEPAKPDHAPAEPTTLDLEAPGEPPEPDHHTKPRLLSPEPAPPEPPDDDDTEVPAVAAPVFEPPAFDPPGAQTDADEEPAAPSPESDDPFTDPASPAEDEPATPETDLSQADSWGVEAEDALSALAGAREPSLEELGSPPIGVYDEEAGAGVEDLLGGVPDPEQEPDSPFDIVIDADGGAAAGESADELVSSPGPSWDDVAEACMALAGAHGSMLVGTSGQLLTAQGEWPEPGPDAIAGRLVSMMERTLQDAPTRSVSAPIAGRHLTAWRIPSKEGYLTIVFMGDAPLSADVRPDIDKHVGRALGD